MCPRSATGEIVVEVVAARALGPMVGFSGIVSRGAGPAPGEEVFGRVPAAAQSGAFVACRGDAVAPKPCALAHREAAVLAAVGPAADSAIRASGAGPGDRVMITGAGDDAGAIAVQLASARGYHVTALCRDRDVPRVWELGADAVFGLARGSGDIARFAAVIDTDRSITPELAERWLRPDGRWIAIRDGRVDLATPRGAPIAARAEAITLRELAALVERDRIFPIAGD